MARNQKEWPAGDDAGKRLHCFWQKREGPNLLWESSTLEGPAGEGLLAVDLDDFNLSKCEVVLPDQVVAAAQEIKALLNCGN